eukprot:2074456-Rhodomonas_salina.1
MVTGCIRTNFVPQTLGGATTSRVPTPGQGYQELENSVGIPQTSGFRLSTYDVIRTATRPEGD